SITFMPAAGPAWNRTENFNGNSGGFDYEDDVFRPNDGNSGDPAVGNLVSSPGGSTALHVRLGGESGTANQINGGWITTFDLAFATTVTISVDVWIATSSATDADDSAELRVSLDGTQYGNFNGAHGSAVLRASAGASANG